MWPTPVRTIDFPPGVALRSGVIASVDMRVLFLEEESELPNRIFEIDIVSGHVRQHPELVLDGVSAEDRRQSRWQLFVVRSEALGTLAIAAFHRFLFVLELDDRPAGARTGRLHLLPLPGHNSLQPPVATPRGVLLLQRFSLMHMHMRNGELDIPEILELGPLSYHASAPRREWC